jgi:polyvinyl alcohol dehydrogenase (cytochrome)
MSKLACCLLLAIIAQAIGQPAPDTGAQVYKRHCAACHDSGAVRIPPESVLRQRTSAAISQALDSGVMKQQGAALSASDRLTVARWLGRKTAFHISPANLTDTCKTAGALGSGANLPSWSSWGAGLANWRFQDAKSAGLSAVDVPRLKLKWAFAVPNATKLRSQSAVYGGRLCFGAVGTVYSLDAATGCSYWATELPAPIRSGIAIGSPDGKPLVFFGDVAGQVHALDMLTGKPVWQMRADAHPAAMVTATPVYDGGRLYIGASSFEELTGAAPGNICCTFRGSVLALEAQSGKLLWQTFTIGQTAKPGRATRRGAKTAGPSGAGVWSAPTIDPGKGVLYATTGDNYSDPPTSASDAVLALSMETGKLLWSKQLKSGDAFNLCCMDSESKTCPDSNGSDFDFGSSAILTTLPNGRRALVLTQKSGMVYAVDPDAGGRLLWKAPVGQGGVLGGVEWGAASDGRFLYVALSDEAFLPTGKPSDPFHMDPHRGGGMFGLRLDNGERVWMTPAPACDSRRPCSPAQQAAVTAIPGAVFSGSLDGHLRAYSAVTGKIVWD